ncbi:MFS transporter [Pseudohalocynthiibacter aestuariivivens]|jgi:MFS transporter, UMF1 family|uniref:MFS transporter n=1 Tax=Pseudohalocynthiibacter aestuariivivens TaxID=1591409 RepID=A0ABV5JJC8_9RHOB|nr:MULTISPECIES: MFS transporter [Pseudohalocynthiibacter]MBS9718317.1 MFS transporter [Pseudohalocynthiibacter aestuariivivens]MCK0103540.1 MFS transporter [Pseudohalocynthiibacter sp. F2068]
MAEVTLKKKIWGWFFFDWASQPYNTLLLTFIFGPYIKSIIGDGADAQAIWGFGVAAAGILIALFAPILGAIADNSGNRIRWIWLFSLMYFVGAFGLWWSAPDNFNLTFIMVSFVIGLIGMEFATIFTNSMLPDLGPREEIGRLSGNGWAFGYVGGLLALITMLLFFAEQGNGKTLAGLDPLFGLDATAREGTRFVGPLAAIWFAVFMIPFFLWVKDPKQTGISVARTSGAMSDLWKTIKRLPRSPSLFAYLGSSMFYRDALNGIYTFGGIYAAGVLEWSTVDTGIFGILAIITGAVFAWIGGRADAAYGPKPVIKLCVVTLTIVAVLVVFVSRTHVFGIAVDASSKLPDIAFYVLGAAIGAAGGALQSASRTMMVYQANPNRMTEAFGLYALSGKATSFIAPLLIGTVTAITGSQSLGISPLIALFVLGLVLLRWVKPEGDHGA